MMRKPLSVFFSTLLFITVACQEDYIQRIEYERVIAPNIDNYMKDLAESGLSYPKRKYKEKVLREYSKKSVFYLEISDDVSNFYQVHGISNEQAEDDDDGFEFHLGTEKRRLIQQKRIRDLAYLQERFVGDEKFIVQDTLNSITWSFVDESKVICDKKVKKATYYNSKINANITAWYSLENNTYSHGPSYYWGLPGTILEVDMDYTNDKANVLSINYACSKIERLKAKKFNEIDGVKISEEAYNLKVKQFVLKLRSFNSQGVDTSE